MIERTVADLNFRNSTRDYKEITLNPAAKFLGNSETLERKVSVWRIRGQLYVTDVKYVLDVWGYPMGLREAPYGLVQEFKGRDGIKEDWVKRLARTGMSEQVAKERLKSWPTSNEQYNIDRLMQNGKSKSEAEEVIFKIFRLGQ